MQWSVPGKQVYIISEFLRCSCIIIDLHCIKNSGTAGRVTEHSRRSRCNQD